MSMANAGHGALPAVGGQPGRGTRIPQWRNGMRRQAPEIAGTRKPGSPRGWACMHTISGRGGHIILDANDDVDDQFANAASARS
jgi:hypothetical protein